MKRCELNHSPRRHRMILACSLSVLTLQPPRLLHRTKGVAELIVPVSENVSVLLLEADESEQGKLVDAALSDVGPVGTAMDDPYGVVLWPAGQVVAQAIAARDLQGRSLLELGAGTGLCSIAAAACGAAPVLATDYREEPLALLQQSAARTSKHLGVEVNVQTRLYDIKADTEALPVANLVVAADLLYMRSTSVALARRCAEALRSPECEAVIVGDLGRPGRAAFLEELVALGVRPGAAKFEEVEGWTAGTARHELISSNAEGSSESNAPRPRSVSVGLLQLTSEDLA